MPDLQMITVKQAQVIARKAGLRCSLHTVYRWVRKGQVDGYTVAGSFRVDQASLEEFIRPVPVRTGHEIRSGGV